MERSRIAIGGVVTAVLVAGVGLVVLLGPGEPAEPVTQVPVANVDSVEDTPTATAEPTAPVVPRAVVDAPPAAVNTEPVNPPEETVPAPGVPYDSDGRVGELNPPNMKPGEVAPLPQPAPPTETVEPTPVQPGPPTETTTQD